MSALSAFLLAASTLTAQQYTISTFAGIGVPPLQPTPVPAAKTSIATSSAVADQAGSIYFTSGAAVWKVDRDGMLNRIAGTGSQGYSGDGGPALSARFSNPTAIALDAIGNVFVVDVQAIRRISIAGTVTTVVNGNSPIPDGTPTGTTSLNPFQLAVDPYGNLYFTNPFQVLRISPGGFLTRVTAPPGGPPPAEGDSAAHASLTVDALAADARGVFLADHVNRRIWLISPDGNIRTFAVTLDPAAPTKFTPFSPSHGPSGVALDGHGNVFFLNQYSQIGKVAPNGTVSLVPGFDSVPSPDTCLDDSPIQSIAADSAGNLYVIESSRILRVSADGKIENIAGNDNFLLGDGGPATSAVLTYPWGVAIGPQGAVYFTDAFNWSVRKVDATGTITTIAGNGHPTSRCGVPTPENPIVTPMQIAVDPAGSLFVASTQNRVVKFDVDGIRNVVAGDGYTGPPGTVEAPLTTTLKDPHGVAVDSRGNLYIADTFESRIQVMSPDGVVRTLTGTGEQGDSGDGGDPFVAKLYAPTSIALDAAGNLYFADTGNQRIRKVALGGIITTVAGSNSAKNSRRWRPRHSSAIMLSARCRRRCGWQSLYQRYLLRPDSQGHPERHHLHHRPR